MHLLLFSLYPPIAIISSIRDSWLIEFHSSTTRDKHSTLLLRRLPISLVFASLEEIEGQQEDLREEIISREETSAKVDANRSGRYAYDVALIIRRAGSPIRGSARGIPGRRLTRRVYCDIWPGITIVRLSRERLRAYTPRDVVTTALIRNIRTSLVSAR